MKLKTYTATTMAQALAQVRKDLGTDAMILHTRSYRTGSWLGLGGKPMVEITASSPQPTKSRKPRRVKRTPVAQPIEKNERIEKPMPEIVVQRSRVAQPVAATPQGMPTEKTPVDDRAALLQGLMGGVGRVGGIGGVEPQSIRQHVVDEPIEPTPIDDGFEPTTFRSIDAVAEEPVLIDETPVVEETVQVAFEHKPLMPAGNAVVFEMAMTPFAEEMVKAAEPVIEEPTEPEPVSEPVHEPVIEPVAMQSSPETDALKAQIESLQKMMGQVLDSTRRTAVAVSKTNPDGAIGGLPAVEMSAPLHALYIGMIDNDVAVDLADRFVGAVRDRLDADELADASVVRHALLREIESSIKTVSESLLTTTTDRKNTDRAQVLALIGPTGVGKTTTVAKIAATAKLRHGKKVALITSDTYRIAAVEQLRTYAAIIGLEFKIANSPKEMATVIDSLKEVDLIVIDTAGRSQNNHARLDELGRLIAAAQPDETHLVLSSTVGDNVLRKTAERFMGLGPDRCILTKIDEAVTTGMIAGMSDRIGLPLSFVTIGQEVPEDILPARAERLARAVLDGPGAVVPGS